VVVFWSYSIIFDVTAPHGRPNLRSRLHSCHAQEGGPQSPQGHAVALDQKKNYTIRGHAVAQWLRHCATNWKIAGSIPDGIIRINHWHNPSGRIMALGLTQPLAEMSTRNISWGQRWPVRRADNPSILMCRLSWNLGTSTSWNPQDLFWLVMGLLYLYYTVQYLHVTSLH